MQQSDKNLEQSLVNILLDLKEIEQERMIKLAPYKSLLEEICNKAQGARFKARLGNLHND